MKTFFTAKKVEPHKVLYSEKDSSNQYQLLDKTGNLVMTESLMTKVDVLPDN